MFTGRCSITKDLQYTSLNINPTCLFEAFSTLSLPSTFILKTRPEYFKSNDINLESSFFVNMLKVSISDGRGSKINFPQIWVKMFILIILHLLQVFSFSVPRFMLVFGNNPHIYCPGAHFEGNKLMCTHCKYTRTSLYMGIMVPLTSAFSANI